jgi:hypothetical protein
MAISQINQNSLATGVPTSVASSALPAGTILQVVSATNGTAATSTTSTYVDTGLSATITPKSATSKILVLVSVPDGKTTGTSGAGISLKIVRNSTDIFQFDQFGWWTNSDLYLNGTSSCNYLDSPATTSSTTYKIQFAASTTPATVRINRDSLTSSMTLLEVAV